MGEACLDRMQSIVACVMGRHIAFYLGGAVGGILRACRPVNIAPVVASKACCRPSEWRTGYFPEMGDKDLATLEADHARRHEVGESRDQPFN